MICICLWVKERVVEKRCELLGYLKRKTRHKTCSKPKIENPILIMDADAAIQLHGRDLCQANSFCLQMSATRDTGTAGSLSSHPQPSIFSLGAAETAK